MDGATNVEDDGSSDAGNGAAAGDVLLVEAVEERAGREVIGVVDERGDVIDVAAAPPGGVGAEAFGAGEGEDPRRRARANGERRDCRRRGGGQRTNPNEPLLHRASPED